MFNDSNSFYYCPAADITNTTQRRHQKLNTAIGDGDGNNSVTADDRFFWNKHMLTELIDSSVSSLYSHGKDTREHSHTIRWALLDKPVLNSSPENSRHTLFNFYARKQLLLSACLSHRNSIRLSVCSSVCLSHGWISQKRCNLGSPNLYHLLPGRL